ncbi:MAG: spondin domain-containing protein [Planctomycetota bacterium]
MDSQRLFSIASVGAFSAAAIAAPAAMAATTDLQVSITNNAPVGGVYITPVWVGFHDGSFDSYNGGLSSQPGLERVAEDGDTSQIAADFAAGLTYIDNSGISPVSATVASSQAGSDRVGGTLGGGPIAPGATVDAIFEGLDLSSENTYFSYASMILPSSDYYIANGNPFAHGLAALDGASVGTEITFYIGAAGTINDAGTEVNDFATGPGNGLFPQLGLPAGQNAPDQGADQNGVNANVVGIPYTGFLNAPGDFDTNPASALLNFNNVDLYGPGVARVTITVVPEPASLGLLGVAAAGLLLRRRRSS